MAIGMGLAGSRGSTLGGTAPPVAVEDLMQGLNDWRNIQSVVRVTFKAFHDILRTQGEAIRALEQSAAASATRAEMTAALGQKASAAEMNQRFEDLEYRLKSKADRGQEAQYASVADVNSALAGLKREVQSMLDHQPGLRQYDSWRESLESKMSDLQRELRQKPDMDAVQSQLESKASSVEVASALSSKVDMAELMDRLNDKVSKRSLDDLRGKVDTSVLDDLERALKREIYEVRDDLNKTFKELAVHKADSKDIDALAGELQQLKSQRHAGTDAMSSQVRSMESRFESMVNDVSSRVQRADPSGLREQLRVLESKVNACEVSRSELSRKVDEDDVKRMLGRKVDTSQMNEALASKANVASVQGILDRLDSSRESAMYSTQELSTVVSSLREEITTKVGMREIGTLLDVKANIEDVNAALLEVSNELDRKAALEALDALRQEQINLRGLFSVENAVGRWIWKSGRTKAGGTVPWNLQSVNTDADNMHWEKDKCSITVDVPGLYEVTFGFFSRRKPTVQLLVNGEPVLAAVNSASYVVHHSSGRLTSVGRHSAGNITGLTLIDFLALPPHAKLAITYNGEDPGEGFLSLKKL
mmetsp:Transcript_37162/g.94967  ORF Transcript_37162/g.94967 Transcript_37162/m.94967 type:complete len:591 (-) Transcript_37162:23-1795(-)|eukprot:jgi/Tetstr1/428969/TSEL_018944.t1